MRATTTAPRSSIGRLHGPRAAILLAASLLAICAACQGADEAAAVDDSSQQSGTAAASTPSASAAAPAAGAPSAATASSAAPASAAEPAAAAAAMPNAPGPTPAGVSMDPPQPPVADEAKPPAGEPTLFWLDISSGRVYRAKADGSGAHVIAMGSDIEAPDGIAVDVAGGHVYWSNMGTSGPANNKASVQRSGLDGGAYETLIKPGSGINTAKQMTIDHANQKLYIADREGATIWRADMDGKNLEPLISDHGLLQLVGIAVDAPGGKFYFSDRNDKKLYRASIQLPDGETAANRTDLELLYVDEAANAMPLDIDLDLEQRLMYWTDRQQNLVQRMGMDVPAGKDASTRDDIEKLVMNQSSAIGITIDKWAGLGYVTAGGAVSSFKLDDGSNVKRLAQPGSTGITIVRIPVANP